LAQVEAVFCHHRLLGMVQTYVLVMSFSSCLNQMSGLSNVHFSILARHAISAWHFQSQIILNELKKAGEFPWLDICCLNVGFNSTLLIQLKIVLTNGKNTTEAGSSLRCFMLIKLVFPIDVHSFIPPDGVFRSTE
jgi:hypothetical protein